MTNPAEQFVGKLVVLRYAGRPASYHAIGRCVAYESQPTVLIQTASGRKISWQANLADVIEGLPDEALRELFP